MRRSQPTSRPLATSSELVAQPVKAPVPPAEPKIIKQKHLVNLLNRLNFQDQTILVNFRHPKYNRVISLRAQPQPCLTDYLECRWHETVSVGDQISQFEFQNFQINNGLNQILVEADLLGIDEERIRLQLPECGYEVTARKVRRHACAKPIYAQISQTGIVFYGLLSGFSAVSFTIDISMVPQGLTSKINPLVEVNIIFKDEREVVYSGDCEIIRLMCTPLQQTLALRPLTNHLQRFRPKQNRTKRQVLSPSPNCVFRHPVTDRVVNLKIVNLSSTGFLVEENQDNSVLLPGLILRDIGIEHASNLVIAADAQVLYRLEEQDGTVRCGLVILDMSVVNQVRISSLLHLGSYEHSYVCTTNLDLDELWNFFFETGFVYPEKYVFIQGQKERFKKLYKKLYTESPEIARYVIYQDKGVIYGHVAMVRFYARTWLLHHHAAISSGHHKAGLVVMDHILNYINAFHKIPAANMRYIACYYQPNNRFASRVFGGSVKAFGDARKCSMDEFAYFHQPAGTISHVSPGSLVLAEADSIDLRALELFYRHISNGLLLEAFDLVPWLAEGEEGGGETARNPFMGEDDSELDTTYQQLGFRRERRFFSLEKNGERCAILVINLADLGLNMSDLTNCVQVFVLEPDKLEEADLRAALAQVSFFYEQSHFPVLIFPRSYADNRSFSYDKVYELGILDLEYICPYLRFINELLSGQKIRRLDKAPAH